MQRPRLSSPRIIGTYRQDRDAYGQTRSGLRLLYAAKRAAIDVCLPVPLQQAMHDALRAEEHAALAACRSRWVMRPKMPLRRAGLSPPRPRVRRKLRRKRPREPSV